MNKLQWFNYYSLNLIEAVLMFFTMGRIAPGWSTSYLFEKEIERLKK